MNPYKWTAIVSLLVFSLFLFHDVMAGKPEESPHHPCIVMHLQGGTTTVMRGLGYIQKKDNSFVCVVDKRRYEI